ncbi:uncharacterized protein Dvir_GJ26949 [Drosophila virilis]|uniref:Gustatory receptor n=1 Tax=Drosophila virilis TaxID=7244 RepID=A0A0Q9WGL0_DROVI|nr:uncharacterized protein Dvir_GJ26949 [Drosophila virilis]
MPMRKKIQKVLECQRMYYRLIRMINELCTIFKYPLFLYLIYLVHYYALSGYTLIQMLFGKKLSAPSRNMNLIFIYTTIIEAAEFYILVSIAHMANTLHEHTFYVLRYPYPDLDLLERSNDWFALQLTWQNKNVHIFGIFIVSRQLVFLVFTSIVLHIIYMVQSDYNILRI